MRLPLPDHSEPPIAHPQVASGTEDAPPEVPPAPVLADRVVPGPRIPDAVGYLEDLAKARAAALAGQPPQAAGPDALISRAISGGTPVPALVSPSCTRAIT